MKTNPFAFPDRSGFRLGLLLVGLLLNTSFVTGQERSPLNEDGKMIDFERDIRPIFMARCYACHNEDDAKADFRIDDPDTVLGYIEPEDAEASTMFYDYMLSEDPDMMMPPPSKGGPLTPAELAMVRVWINEGADWPEGVTLSLQPEASDTEVIAESIPADAGPRSLFDRVWSFQGFLHPATVHFPVALFLVGGFFVVLSWKWPALGTQIPLACLLIGALTAVASTAMGWSFAVEEGYGSWTKVDFDNEVFWHRWSGVIVTVLSVVFALIALRSIRHQDSSGKVWKGGLLVLALLVGLVGHQGGELSYGADFYPKAFRILFGTEGEVADASAELPVEGEADDVAADDADSTES
ncbi:c-type cytochrome domain-containing protein [Roseiconus lacunae]|uniref:c-type cytochrome domain-containing protein n=1 Tax=Roseiconus lacunae TaxID=2605694 RepID=UPI002AA5B1D7|nr:cytochrome C [Roseiconus lacunae]WRQ51981.1 c-type cytochrome domain-containing protein [Stieleria sp. HD01]